MLKKVLHYANRARYHRMHRMLPEMQGGSGACGQDMLVADLLGNKRGGFFVDIGANDGVTISNTYFLEKEMGWSGVAVEPIPTIFAKLQANRNCHLVNGCIAPDDCEAEFLEVVGGPNMLSTLAFNDHGLTARRLRKNAARYNAELRSIQVQCLSVATLVDRYDIKEIDFLSIDTEGGELEILKAFDFERVPVRCVSVENNYYTGSIRRYMESQGFLHVGTFKIDEIYVFGGTTLRSSIAKAA